MIVNRAVADRWDALSEQEREAVYDAWNDRSLDDPARSVDELIGEISQSMYASSWSDTIPGEVWRLLHNFEYRRQETTHDFHAHCTGAELSEMLDEVEQLTIKQGWYPIYGAGERSYLGVIMPLDEAAQAYAGSTSI